MINNSHQYNFECVVAEQIQAFPSSLLLKKTAAGTITLKDYETLLRTLFHQTYSSPYTFARAAVNCDWRHERAKEYLLQHAEEERTHWRWVLADLKAICAECPSLREDPPHPTCQAYIAFNYFVAEQIPVARLAIAAVLEGIGATHGATYGKIMLSALKLSTNQASFFLSHAETDKSHIVELSEVITQCALSDDEWRWMTHAASTAGTLYRAMYEHSEYA